MRTSGCHRRTRARHEVGTRPKMFTAKISNKKRKEREKHEMYDHHVRMYVTEARAQKEKEWIKTMEESAQSKCGCKSKIQYVPRKIMPFPAFGAIQGETQKLGSGRAWARARSRTYMKARSRYMARGWRIQRGRHPVSCNVGPGSPR